MQTAATAWTGIPAGDYTIGPPTDVAGNDLPPRRYGDREAAGPDRHRSEQHGQHADGQTATTHHHRRPARQQRFLPVEDRETRGGVTRTAENQYQFTATVYRHRNGSYTVEVTTADNLSASVALQVTGIQEKTNEPPVIQLGEQQLNAAMTEVAIPGHRLRPGWQRSGCQTHRQRRLPDRGGRQLYLHRHRQRQLHLHRG